MSRDILYMRRCLDLARMAQGHTSPNPMVGAIIVHKDRIIGQGYHHRAGLPHAEVLAFSSISEQDHNLISHSTLYVSLEPCSHYGKTPPCCELIAQKRPKRVVVAMEDPFEQVRGRGIRYLRERGIEVECGVCEEEARWLNRFFITAHVHHRPFVTLKWAQSRDGYIDKEIEGERHSVLLSSSLRLREVHRLRAYHDAVLVGNGTALTDNPQLTNRFWWGHQPLRVVLCGKRKLGRTSHLLNDSYLTLLVVHDSTYDSWVDGLQNTHLLHLLPHEGIHELLYYLYQRGIHSLLVEGGAYTLQQFIDNQLYDAIEREIAPINLGKGTLAPNISLV